MGGVFLIERAGRLEKRFSRCRRAASNPRQKLRNSFFLGVVLCVEKKRASKRVGRRRKGPSSSGRATRKISVFGRTIPTENSFPFIAVVAESARVFSKRSGVFLGIIARPLPFSVRSTFQTSARNRAFAIVRAKKSANYRFFFRRVRYLSQMLGGKRGKRYENCRFVRKFFLVAGI